MTFCSCSTQLNMKFCLLIISLLAEKFSCLAIFSKKEFEIVNNLRFISRLNLMLI